MSLFMLMKKRSRGIKSFDFSASIVAYKSEGWCLVLPCRPTLRFFYFVLTKLSSPTENSILSWQSLEFHFLIVIYAFRSHVVCTYICMYIYTQPQAFKYHFAVLILVNILCLICTHHICVHFACVLFVCLYTYVSLVTCLYLLVLSINIFESIYVYVYIYIYVCFVRMFVHQKENSRQLQFH